MVLYNNAKVALLRKKTKKPPKAAFRKEI